MEISQLRSGWNDSAKIILSPARDDGRMRIFRRPFRTDYVLGREPGTLCRANFQLSLRDDAITMRSTREDFNEQYVGKK
jgi:hypothetical protein